MPTINYRKQDKKIATHSPLRGEGENQSMADGVSSSYWADVYREKLRAALESPVFNQPGPYWLDEVRDELAAGRAGTLTKTRIDQLSFSLESKSNGTWRPSTRDKKKGKSVSSLKWEANAKAFAEMTLNRPLKPPTGKP
jgi:hypothetical protein